MSDHGIDTHCDVYALHIRVTDFKKIVSEMMESFRDLSWVNNLHPIDRKSYSSKAEQAIELIVDGILEKIQDEISIDIGEYLVSEVALRSLNEMYDHERLPAADLFKERRRGNGGFDFHTESKTPNLMFGEAKFSKGSTKYTEALGQINDFIDDNKDTNELSDLRHFVSDILQTALEEEALPAFPRRGYVAAFSINAKDPNTIMNNAIEHEHLKRLLNYPEVYLIGVEVE